MNDQEARTYTQAELDAAVAAERLARDAWWEASLVDCFCSLATNLSVALHERHDMREIAAADCINTGLTPAIIKAAFGKEKLRGDEVKALAYSAKHKRDENHGEAAAV